MVSAKNIILSIAIAIVFMLLGVYGINLFYEEPQYQDFCGQEGFPKVAPLAREQRPCQVNVSLDAQMQQCYNDGNAVIKQQYDQFGCLAAFECSTCQKDFDNAMEEWEKKAFISAVVFGIIGIAVGAIWFSLESVGAGLMGGGALLILGFSMRVWRNLGDIVRFVILLAALVVLIYLGYRINKRKR